MAMAQRGPAAARDDNRGDIDIEPKLVSGNYSFYYYDN